MEASLTIVRASSSRSGSHATSVFEKSSARPTAWPFATSGSITSILLPFWRMRMVSAGSASGSSTSTTTAIWRSRTRKVSG